MLFYWGKTFGSERVGQRLVRVECTECGCEYFYILARIGTGVVTAAYGIGQAGASRRAEEQSQGDLEERLARDAELVPCPKCNWVSAELVRGFRLSRYQGFGGCAFVIAFAGTSLSLIGAWFIHVGPPVDHTALPYLLFAGPALFISLAVGMILLGAWLRSRIRPYRNDPEAPRLPPGTPPALLREIATGELKPAKQRRPETAAANDGIDFQVGRHEFPEVCCDCLKKAAAGHGWGVSVIRGIGIEVPRCEDCPCRASQWSRRVFWPTVVVLLLLWGPFVLTLGLYSCGFWLLATLFLILSIILGAGLASKVEAPVKVRAGDQSRGVVRLHFRNPGYGPVLVKHLDDSGKW